MESGGAAERRERLRHSLSDVDAGLLRKIDDAAGSTEAILNLDDENHAFRQKFETEAIMNETLWDLVQHAPPPKPEAEEDEALAAPRKTTTSCTC